VGKGTVAVVNRFLGWGHLTENSLGVHINGLGVLVLLKESVSLGLKLFSSLDFVLRPVFFFLWGC